MSTQILNEGATQTRTPVTIDQKLEVVVIPVADVDRARRFYETLGWRLDSDLAHGDDWRLVQMTPPGSPCSVMFGRGVTSAVPGSLQGAFLVVDDLETARNELGRRGVEVVDREERSLHRSGHGSGKPLADHDGARRSGRCQLHQTPVVAVGEISIQPPTLRRTSWLGRRRTPG